MYQEIVILMIIIDLSIIEISLDLIVSSYPMFSYLQVPNGEVGRFFL
jgi:hypothetical protein